MLRNHGVYPVQFVLKDLVRDTVTEYLPRKAIAPDFDLADLLVREPVDPATLGDESADQAIVTLYGSLFTRGIRMGKIEPVYCSGPPVQTTVRTRSRCPW